MSDPHDELKDDVLSNLYQRTRIEEPPMALDSAILSQARQAVEKPQHRSLWSRMGWVAPLASMAVVMLTVSVVIQMKQQHPESLAPTLMDAAPKQKQNITHDAESVMELKEEGASSRQAAEKKDAYAPSAQPNVAPVESLNEMAPAKSLVPKPATAPSSIEAIPQRKLKIQTREVAPAGVMSDSTSDAISGGGADDRMQREPEALGSVRAKTVAKPAAERMSADQWLTIIREAIQAGQLDEAAASLNAFKQAYPDEPVPEDIASALAKQQ